MATGEARVLVDAVGAEACLSALFVPLRKEESGDLLVLVADPLSREPDRVLREAFGLCRISKLVGSDLDVARLVMRLRQSELLRETVESLARSTPEYSATTVLGRGQRATLALALAAVVITAIVWPRHMGVSVLLALNALFLLATAFKLFVGLFGLHDQVSRRIRPAIPPAGRMDWPVYTILVPLYRESPSVVSQLIRNLEALDYPRERMDVIMLLEEDDDRTMLACKALAPPGFVRLLTVPPSLPRTKPKALDWGLLFAQGEYLTIYDAEDAPDPEQLKRAVLWFEKAERDVVCVQAALNFYNARANLLTRMFALEYSAWFDNLVPGLRRLGLAFPLGGTSNHFRTEALQRVGGWDPFNVTEDADLGFRFQRLGYRVAYLASTTYEEASSRLMQWLRQRSRWVKGYMMTWLVHARRPVRLYRQVGSRGWLSFHLLIGGTPLVFLAHLPLGLMSLLALVEPQWIDPLYPSPLRAVALAIWAGGITSAVLASALGVLVRRWWWLLVFSLLTPVYWLLHSCAAWWALYELVFRPFYWQRTPHGYHLAEPIDFPVEEDRVEKRAA